MEGRIKRLGLPGMKTANELIFDKLVKHQIYLLRLIAKQGDDFAVALNKNNPQLTAFLNERISGLDLARTYSSAAKWKRFETALKELRGFAIDGFVSDYDKESIKIIDNETKYMKALYDNSIAIKEIATVIPAVNKVNLLNYGNFAGKTLLEHFDELKYGDADRIILEVRNGLLNRQPAYKIVNSIIGSKDQDYADGITNITRNNARMVVRTVTSGISNASREEFYKANQDIIKVLRFTAVLDGRTTWQCLGLDGETYKVTESMPGIPLHRG